MMNFLIECPVLLRNIFNCPYYAVLNAPNFVFMYSYSVFTCIQGQTTLKYIFQPIFSQLNGFKRFPKGFSLNPCTNSTLISQMAHCCDWSTACSACQKQNAHFHIRCFLGAYLHNISSGPIRHNYSLCFWIIQKTHSPNKVLQEVLAAACSKMT